MARPTPPEETGGFKAVLADPKAIGALADLDKLIGLESVKEWIRGLYALLKFQRIRKSRGFRNRPAQYHLAFVGAPGTGKTTVARIMGRVFFETGVLQVGNVVEVSRAELVGQHIGETAQKVMAKVREAMDGVLFIDEAHALVRSLEDQRDFGREAVDTLVKAMEDHRQQLVVILAGYPYEMTRFLASNPGLRSRLAEVVTFPDYPVSDLMQMAAGMAAEGDYEWEPEALARLEEILSSAAADPEFGNARYMRTLVERTERAKALRLWQQKVVLSWEELYTLRLADLELAMKQQGELFTSPVRSGDD